MIAGELVVVPLTAPDGDSQIDWLRQLELLGLGHDEETDNLAYNKTKITTLHNNLPQPTYPCGC